MPRVAMVIAGLALLSGTARAVSDKGGGNDLLTYCSAVVPGRLVPGTEFVAGHCVGYVQGVREMCDLVRAALPTAAVCVPTEATASQLIKVLVKYLNDHPERLHEQNLNLTLSAFEQAFPCKRRSHSLAGPHANRAAHLAG